MYNPAKISSNFFTTHRKGTAKFTAKLKNMYIIYLLRVVVFWKHVLML